MTLTPTQPICEVVILTALPVEYQAALRYLEDPHEVVHPSGTIYHHGRITGEQQTWRVVVVFGRDSGTHAHVW